MIIKLIKKHYLKKVQKQNRLNLVLEQSIREHGSSKSIFDARKEEHQLAAKSMNDRISEFEKICGSDKLQTFLNYNGREYNYGSYDDWEMNKKILSMAPNFKNVLEILEKERDNKNRDRSQIQNLSQEKQDLESKLELAKSDLTLAIKSMKQENVELRLLLRKAAHLENADNLVEETKLQLETLDGDIRMIGQPHKQQ